MERKRKCRAEYSAAVSRLADSWCSCSECTMRGIQCAQEYAVKEQKGNKERKREQAHVSTNVYKWAWFHLLLCVLMCGQLQLEFPLPFGELVERPASEENSILSCSYAVVNHQAGMSNTFYYFANNQLSFAFFVVSTFPCGCIVIFS